MDTMNRDMALLNMSERRAGSVVDMLQPNVQNPAFRSAQYTFFSNSFLDISAGNIPQSTGLSGNSNSTISYKPQIGNAILNLQSMIMAFKYIGVDALTQPINMLSLFKPVACKIDQFSKNYAYGEEFVQQCLEGYSLSRIQAYKKMLWIGNLDCYDQAFLLRPQLDVTSLATIVTTGYVGESAFKAINTNYAVNQSTVAAGYTQGYHSAMNQYLAGKALDGDKNVIVPLKFIFPYLFESLGNALFVKFPNQLEFQIQLVPFIENCVTVLAADTTSTYTAAVPAGDYKLVNFYASYQYNVITDTQGILNNIERSIFEYHPKYTIPFVAPLLQVTQLSFAISAKQEVHELLFACHPNSGALRGATAISSSATYYGTNCMQGECIQFPAFKIQQMTIDINGKIITMNSQAIAALQLLQPINLTDLNSPYEEGGYTSSNMWQTQRCAYKVSLTRFINDVVGSSTGQSTNVIVSIFWDFTEDLSIYGKNNSVVSSQTIALVNSVNGGVIPPNYNVYGFLLVSSTMEMKGGNYMEI